MKTDLDNGKLKSGPLSVPDDADVLLLGGALFALFCLTLELERLGHALESDHQG